jgi:phosphoenolpyruvate-protein phosphotransferase
MKSFAGLPAAPGIAIGGITVHRSAYHLPRQSSDAAPCDPNVEWAAFLRAQEQVDAELNELCERSTSVVAEIFSAHRMMLHDDSLSKSIRAGIFDEGKTAALATHDVVEELGNLFRSFDDEYFAGRAADIIDLGQRLLVHLDAAVDQVSLDDLPPDTILVAEDLRPSDLAQLSSGVVVGIALANSTPTAHSAILARSLGIPLVCALGPQVLELRPNQLAVVDGTAGELQVGRSETGIARMKQRRADYLETQATANDRAQQPAVTVDGLVIPIRGNANSPQEVESAAHSGADGIGLLRTEYLFRGRSSAPTEDEQRQVYVKFVEQTHDHLTVRAMDAGGDKPVRFLPFRHEDNPFLGLRGVRLLIEQPDLLRAQYQALQAATEQARRETGNQVDVRFMLPMISDANEVREVLGILGEVRGDKNHLPIGIMIEVPSAALTADNLAPMVDFLSIGTNDLAQYVLASDRTNSTVARMADPLHPAVLRLIKMTCDAGKAHDRPVSLCGEIAGDAAAVPLLVGLGVRELSAPLPAVPLVKQAIRSISVDKCESLARTALACSTGQEVRALIEGQ